MSWVSVWAVMMMIGTMLLGPQRPAHVEARHVGQPQVEQDEVGLLLGERRQPVGAVGRLAHRVALVLERQPEGQPDRVVVLDEEQASAQCGAILAPRAAPLRPVGSDRFVTEIAQSRVDPSHTRAR